MIGRTRRLQTELEAALADAHRYRVHLRVLARTCVRAGDAADHGNDVAGQLQGLRTLAAEIVDLVLDDGDEVVS